MLKKVVKRQHRLPMSLMSLGLLTLIIGGQCPNTVPPPTTPTTPTTPTAVSFANDIQPIFNANCISCHATGGIAAAIMLLTSADSFAALVNTASVQNSSLTRVVPSSSATSLLFQKVSSASPPVGARMPLGGSALSQANIDSIKNWIDQGAANN